MGEANVSRTLRLRTVFSISSLISAKGHRFSTICSEFWINLVKYSAVGNAEALSAASKTRGRVNFWNFILVFPMSDYVKLLIQDKWVDGLASSSHSQVDEGRWITKIWRLSQPIRRLKGRPRFIHLLFPDGWCPNSALIWSDCTSMLSWVARAQLSRSGGLLTAIFFLVSGSMWETSVSGTSPRQSLTYRVLYNTTSIRTECVLYWTPQMPCLTASLGPNSFASPHDVPIKGTGALCDNGACLGAWRRGSLKPLLIPG